MIYKHWEVEQKKKKKPSFVYEWLNELHTEWFPGGQQSLSEINAVMVWLWKAHFYAAASGSFSTP